ncbi:hypothetical protein GCM10023091_09550 [Ravibacter arvi]|uniref:Glycosyl transferase family 1 domain-containing protein n=2 Tax=Ravibacter arvi TaxID=2051041 RepID=A0ABP8LU53_9BACT
MGYTLAGLRALLQTDRDFELYVVSWDRDNLTPYKFEALAGMNYRRLSEFSSAGELLTYCKSLQPDVLFVCSWNMTGGKYMTVSKYFTAKGIPTICMFDNQWMGTLKQWIGIWTASFFLRKHFTFMWGCGDRQVDFARRLGYSEEKIFDGFYTCDADLYRTIPIDRTGKKHSLLFVGRFVREKGIDLLLTAFREISDDYPEWDLLLVGSGSLEATGLTQGDRINVVTFKQPDALASVFAEASVFCLPSLFEPWGVVIHEAAIAGLPIVCSDACGAGDAFLVEGVNGFKFAKGSKDELKSALIKVMSATDSERKHMGIKSRALGEKNTPEKWSRKFLEIVNKVTYQLY